MSLPDWDLNPVETRRVQATLRDAERVVHVWRPKRSMPPIEAIIHVGERLLIAGILAYMAYDGMNTERDLENRGVQTTATVLKVHEHVHSLGRGRTSVTYAPVLRFTDTAGMQQEIEASIGSSDYNFPIGQQVVIRYMPDSPSTLCIVDDSIPPGTIFALVGGIFVLIGLGIFAIGFKWRKHNKV